MSKWLKNNSGKIEFKLFVISLVILILIGIVFLFVIPENKRNKINKKRISEAVLFEIPTTYDQPLVIKNFNNIFSLQPLEAKASEVIYEEENKVRYIEPYVNTDIVQEKKQTKIKEDIVLKSPGHPVSFRYKLDIRKYDWEKTGRGDYNFYLKGKKGEELYKVFTIPAPFLIDAKGIKSSTKDVETSLSKKGILTLIPNKDWLSGHPYPIVLDPTVEINVLNIQSHPQQGEDWMVQFTTLGTADLKIIPNDQDTIDDDVFTGLYCGKKKVEPQILEGDVIYYPNWNCNSIATVVHYTAKAGKHTLRFEFGDSSDPDNFSVAWAYNDSEPWWDLDWGWRTKITLDNTDQSTGLSNFPVMATSTSAESDFWSNIEDDYRDLRFIDDDGNELYFEIEEFDYSGDDMVAWVKLPYVHATTTDDIWMYYDNSSAATSTYASTTAVWTENYEGVYHLNESSTGAAAVDSSSYGYDRSSGSYPGVVDGQIAGGRDVISTYYYFIFNSNSVVYANPEGTIEIWMNRDFANNIAYSKSLVDFRYSSDERYYIGYDHSEDDWDFIVDKEDTWRKFEISANTWPQSTWAHAAMTWSDGANDDFMYVYANGSSVNSCTTCMGTYNSVADANAYLGSDYNPTGNEFFDGQIDEFRISDVPRSADWQAFQYCNTVGTCGDYTAAEEYTNTPPTVTSVTDSPDPIGVGAELSFSVDWDDADTIDMEKMVICKGSGITTSTATCKDGTWKASDVYTNRDPEVVTYTTQAGDKGSTHDYWAFVCDDKSACSSGTAGTFTVENQTPDAPTGLLVEGYEIGNATNITDTTPEFSAIYNDTNDEGDQANKMCVLVQARPDSFLTDGLLGWWKFEEGTGTSVADSSGNGETGTLSQSDHWTTDGYFDNAYDFDGADDWVDLGDLGSQTAGSILIHFKKDNKNAGAQYLMDGRGTGNFWFLQDYVSGACVDSGGNVCFEGRVEILSTDIVDNAWNQVVVTEDASESKIYLNGALKDTGNGEAPNFTSLRIGTRYTNSGYFNGIIDEVAVWDRILDTDEIAALYEMWEQDSNMCNTGSSITAIDEGDRSSDQAYAGTTLNLDGSKYYWRSWLWDDDGVRSATSTTGYFTVSNSDDTSEGGVRLRSGTLKGNIRLR